MDSSRPDRKQGVLPRSPAPARKPRIQREAGRPPVCLLTTLHPERALSRALVQHLSEEMPDIEFTLVAGPRPSAVWVCGFETGREDLVRGLRLEHPEAFLVVTGRGPLDSWEEEVRQAGADYVCSWPVPYDELSRILRRSRSRGRVPT